MMQVTAAMLRVRVASRRLASCLGAGARNNGVATRPAPGPFRPPSTLGFPVSSSLVPRRIAPRTGPRRRPVDAPSAMRDNDDATSPGGGGKSEGEPRGRFPASTARQVESAAAGKATDDVRRLGLDWEKGAPASRGREANKKGPTNCQRERRQRRGGELPEILLEIPASGRQTLVVNRAPRTAATTRHCTPLVARAPSHRCSSWQTRRENTVGQVFSIGHSIIRVT